MDLMRGSGEGILQSEESSSMRPLFVEMKTNVWLMKHTNIFMRILHILRRTTFSFMPIAIRLPRIFFAAANPTRELFSVPIWAIVIDMAVEVSGIFERLGAFLAAR
jgi:hypothetical protein